MASGVALRKAGARRAPASRQRIQDLIGPALGLSSDGQPGEHRLNSVQISSIEQLFNSHPAVQAAKCVLHGQLLSGGLTLRRNGEEVALKPAFKQHLEETWMPFARDVTDSFLKFGYVVVSYEEDDESLARQLIKKQRAFQAEAEKRKESLNLVPIVPPSNTYDVAYIMTGRAGYKRKYLVYAQSPNMATKIDTEARVVVRQHPDGAGNVNSPMATVFDLGSFVSALTELAMTAEITNARPRIWTQMRAKNQAGALDPQSLFFDSESRGVQSSHDNEDNQRQVDQLAFMQQMTQMVNKLQTTFDPRDGSQPNSFSGGVATGKHSHVPPEASCPV